MDTNTLIIIGMGLLLGLILIRFRLREGERGSRSLHTRHVVSMPTTPEVVKLARDGHKIAAIKKYRALNPGTGLAEAKRVIDALAAGDSVASELLTVAEAEIQIAQLVDAGRKIEAIKAYRDLHPGTSLPEAKQIIEDMIEARR